MGSRHRVRAEASHREECDSTVTCLAATLASLSLRWTNKEPGNAPLIHRFRSMVCTPCAIIYRGVTGIARAFKRVARVAYFPTRSVTNKSASVRSYASHALCPVVFNRNRQHGYQTCSRRSHKNHVSCLVWKNFWAPGRPVPLGGRPGPPSGKALWGFLGWIRPFSL